MTATLQTAVGFGSLSCVASSTHRAGQEDNQDAAAALTLPDGQQSVLVADGLGSFAWAGEAARFVVEASRRLLAGEGGMPLPQRALPELFPRVQAQLAVHAGAALAALPQDVRARIDPSQSWGTTLLVAAETTDLLIAAYVGNGGIFHLRGSFFASGSEGALPWNVTNYLNPHSIREMGREALYRYLGAAVEPHQIEPTTFGLRKDTRFGDILLLCSDGIFSQDQVRYGEPGDGSTWGELSLPLLAVLGSLRTCFAEAADLTAQRLEATLTTCLADLRTRELLDDDATLGLLVTGQACAYRRAQQERGCG